MNVTVNGNREQLPDGHTVAALLEKLGLAARPVAVEVNRKLVRKKDHTVVALSEGDAVEVVTLVGGG
jgi:sulfur carrier protein